MALDKPTQAPRRICAASASISNSDIGRKLATICPIHASGVWQHVCCLFLERTQVYPGNQRHSASDPVCAKHRCCKHRNPGFTSQAARFCPSSFGLDRRELHATLRTHPLFLEAMHSAIRFDIGLEETCPPLPLTLQVCFTPQSFDGRPDKHIPLAPLRVPDKSP